MLQLLDHPLSQHIVTHLRDRTTKPVTFRTLAHQISLLLAIEATRTLRTRAVRLHTPLEEHEGRVLAEQVVVVAILRAGLVMVSPFTDCFPDASVGYIGLERDHETAQAHRYYAKLPPLRGKRVFVLDPMLATGGSAVQAIQIVHDLGAAEITFISVVCSPEGLRRVEASHPGTTIFAAAIDRQLNAEKYILPGLGDFGDRLYGT